MILMTSLSMILSMVLIALNAAISMKKKMERESGSPFECGYDPKSSARVPFSLHFFLVAVIFLIFDVEITLILPMPILMNLLDMTAWTILSVVFIAILIMGTVHEWAEGSLEWSK